MKSYKTGRWSKIELQFIQDNYKSMTTDELSEKLNRPPETINELIADINIPDELKQSELNIRKTHEWKQICQQLTTDEQETFLYHWREIINQFKCDITHTERMQIMDVVRTEILVNRALKRIHQVQLEVDDLDKTLYTERNNPNPDMTAIITNETKKVGLLNALGTLQKEHQTLIERKQGILKDINGTRAQRKKRIEEDVKATLKDWIITLIDNAELRRNLGIELEKFRCAVNTEYERLSEYFTFADNQVNQPILNSDNILSDNN